MALLQIDLSNAFSGHALLVKPVTNDMPFSILVPPPSPFHFIRPMNPSEQPRWRSSSITEQATTPMFSSSDATAKPDGISARRTSGSIQLQIVEDLTTTSHHSQASMCTGGSPIKLSSRPLSEFGTINPLLSTSHSIHLLTPPLEEHGAQNSFNTSLTHAQSSIASSRQFLPASQTSDTVDLLLQKVSV